MNYRSIYNTSNLHFFPHQAEDSVQKVTDTFVKQVDEILAKKEAELMEI